MQVSVAEVGQPGGEIFSFTVCSPSALARTGSGRFVTHTLVQQAFSWSALRARLEKLLAQCGSCESWADVIQRLSPFLRYNDAD